MLRIVVRLLLVPVIAGVSFEIIRLAGRSDNPLVNALSKPGLALQKLTTREPDAAQAEVAIAAVRRCLTGRHICGKISGTPAKKLPARRREKFFPAGLVRPGGSGRSFKECRDSAAAYLRQRGIADAKTDAWLLMEYAANIDRSFYYMHMYEEMPEEDREDYRNLVIRRGEHVPAQYLTGRLGFTAAPSG